MGGLIFIDTSNYPTFCDNRCDNTNCSRHISKTRFYTGGCKISKLRNTEDCEGCIPKKKGKAE